VAERRCPFCHAAVTEGPGAASCARPGCAALHHAECLATYGCAVYGCERARGEPEAEAPIAARAEAERPGPPLALLGAGALALLPLFIVLPELALIPVGLLAVLAFVALQYLVQRCTAAAIGWLLTWVRRLAGR
jgi:hypothetical protein